MKATFKIDFFELMFLAESVIPNQPIARSMCFDSFSDTHYHNMTDNQRVQFFNHVIRIPRFNLENEQCKHFFARFDPDNQYVVHTDFEGKKEKTEAYFYNGEYRVGKDKYISKEYIVKVSEKLRKKVV